MEADRLSDVIRRAQAREPAAIDELVEAYHRRLYGYFYRLTGSRPDAEDLLQEVFVRVVRVISGYQHDGRFDAWLFRIAGNLVRDRIRRIQRSKVGEAPDDGAGGSDDWWNRTPDESMDAPGDGLDRREQLDRMQTAIEQLPEAEREVILLRHFSQLSFREIADSMGTPLGTALARAHRGLTKLRELMNAEETRPR